MSQRTDHKKLLNAMIAFNEILLSGRGYSQLEPFHSALCKSGDNWVDVESCDLPASKLLDCKSTTTSQHLISTGCNNIVEQFAQYRSGLRWEQSYKKEDKVVGEDMLSAYGFAEITGKHGPLLSNTIRSGIGVWGPNITYPSHRHDAQEVYLVIQGSARFCLDNGEAMLKNQSDAVFVSSNLEHGFSTGNSGLIVLYYWLGGNLWQISSFS